ncbi:hypothetical protein HDU97_001671 [Phlyctochytrium planicorne]|nr:hypothetical protein HDU97_001671 [Phlyctochytrium planicorne]
MTLDSKLLLDDAVGDGKNKDATIVATDILTRTLTNSSTFFSIHPPPITTNHLSTLLSSSHLSRPQATAMIQSSHILIHSSINPILTRFLAHKMKHGTDVEKRLYEGMDGTGLLRRLIGKRPLAFYGRHDRTLLRNRVVPKQARLQWKNVGGGAKGGETAGQGKKKRRKDDREVGEGSEGPDIFLKDYLSYHEMQISALVGASTPTIFINPGDRKNLGVPSKPTAKPHIRSGIYVGLVGPRFNGPDECMESEYLLVTSGFSTPENGFGATGAEANPAAYERLALLADLVGDGSGRFPSFEEVKAVDDDGKRFLKLSATHYLNVQAYEKRLGITFAMLLHEANERARIASEVSPESMGISLVDAGGADGSSAGKKKVVARVVVVGFGLGVWKKDARQVPIFVDALMEAIREGEWEYVGEVVVSWIQGRTESVETVTCKSGNDIRIEFSKGNPADMPDEPLVLDGERRERILVASFAWDGNSYPGNEYWFGKKSGSGDSAAASCSLIGELMNPEVNVGLVENVCVVG